MFDVPSRCNDGAGGGSCGGCAAAGGGGGSGWSGMRCVADQAASCAQWPVGFTAISL